jgi:dihydroxyacetone kinase phosphotransfer subunit
MAGMVGIVVVSHSEPLAQAAVDLALEMVSGQPPPVGVAAGAGDGVTGTDAVRIMESVLSVASDAGVLVLMDMGSAVLSAEMALELLGDPGCEVRLSPAPFVEGLVAAVVQAATGADLDRVATEAVSGLRPKQEHLGSAAAAGSSGLAGEAGASLPAEGAAVVEVELRNPHGLHARPAATFVKAASGFDAQVQVTNQSNGRGPADAGSLIAVIAMGADQGHRLRLEATGPQARDAVDRLAAMVKDGFGEL